MPREQKMLKTHLPRVIYHPKYTSLRRKSYPQKCRGRNLHSTPSGRCTFCSCRFHKTLDKIENANQISTSNINSWARRQRRGQNIAPVRGSEIQYHTASRIYDQISQRFADAGPKTAPLGGCGSPGWSSGPAPLPASVSVWPGYESYGFDQTNRLIARKPGSYAYGIAYGIP